MSASFTPNSTLRSPVLRNALKAYVVPPFLKNYNIVALRALWDKERMPVIWKKRREMEIILLANDNIVAFFSCITALQEKSTGKRKHALEEESRKRKYIPNNESDVEESESEEDEESVANVGEKVNYPGVSFWIVCNWPEYGIEKIELELTKQFLEAGLNIRKCRAVRSRGSFILIYIFIFLGYVSLMIY